MSVPVMDVGVMRVRMNQWLMPMWVAVSLSERVRRGVGVLVMLVMRVQMLSSAKSAPFIRCAVHDDSI